MSKNCTDLNICSDDYTTVYVYVFVCVDVFVGMCVLTYN